ncbi:hypothetical protein ACFPT7_05565 [Acidicapsa dinghuensis]|uniref:Uncharacterized protein n=1 Tax=Acidicapsa dinghuensis TaxID=2218256 RepID=A0ABW1ED56_9BACT|nr:hypothetical protein [Acidicapsa dinghuensis]
MLGSWTEEWPERAGVYWALAPQEKEPIFVHIDGPRWNYLWKNWDLDAPSWIWSERMQPPESPHGDNLFSPDREGWSIVWPEIEGEYWLFHPGRPVALSQVTGTYRGFLGTDDVWPREEPMEGELFWSEPILPPSPPESWRPVGSSCLC